MIRLYLLGSKGLTVLKSLTNKQLALISEVIVGKDSGVINDFHEEIIIECKKRNIKIYERNDEPANNPEYSIAIGWKWLIKQSSQLIIIHDSILPRLRGFNPLVSALINGDTEIGATALFASDKYDEGPIICQKSVSISYPIKIYEAIKLIGNIYSELVAEILELIKIGKLIAYPQNNSQGTYSLWRDEEDYIIDWKKDSKVIKRFIDSVGFPYKGAKTFLENEPYRILDSEHIDDLNIENRMPGKIIFKDKSGMTIVCGKGLLKVPELYSDDLSKIVSFKQFRLRFK